MKVDENKKKKPFEGGPFACPASAPRTQSFAYTNAQPTRQSQNLPVN